MRKVVCGVIGAGRLGKTHIKNLLSLPKAFLKTIADPRKEETEKWARNFGKIKITGNWIEIMEDPEIEAVIIASPTSLHAEMIRVAVEHGKDVFTEKPISHDLDSAKKLVESLKNRKAKIQVAFNRRFDHNYRKLRGSVEKGKIGVPQLIRITIRDPSLPPLEFVKNSGGIFFDFFIHEFDNLRFITGMEVEEVYAGGSNLWNKEFEKFDDFDTAFTVLKMQNGALAVIDSSRKACYGYDQRMEIFGSRGSVSSSNDSETEVEFQGFQGTVRDKPWPDFQTRYADSFFEELKDFIEVVFNDKDPSVTLEDGYKAILIAQAATVSAREKKRVKINEIENSFSM